MPLSGKPVRLLTGDGIFNMYLDIEISLHLMLMSNWFVDGCATVGLF